MSESRQYDLEPANCHHCGQETMLWQMWAVDLQASESGKLVKVYLRPSTELSSQLGDPNIIFGRPVTEPWCVTCLLDYQRMMLLNKLVNGIAG